MGTVDGLSPFIIYNCTIHVVIMTSDGSMSDPIVVRTAEAGKSYYLLSAIYLKFIHQFSSQSSSD